MEDGHIGEGEHALGVAVVGERLELVLEAVSHNKGLEVLKALLVGVGSLG